jgi:hypothetical protein
LRQRYIDEQAEARAQRALQPGKALGRDLGGSPPASRYANAWRRRPQRHRGDRRAGGRAASVVCALRAC